METSELQSMTNAVCLTYTHAKAQAQNKQVSIDTAHLLRRINEEVGELAEQLVVYAGMPAAPITPRTEVAEELADVLNTVFMLASHLNLDVESLMKLKLHVLGERTDQLRRNGYFEK